MPVGPKRNTSQKNESWFRTQDSFFYSYLAFATTILYEFSFSEYLMNKVGKAASILASSGLGGGSALTTVALAGEVAGLSAAGIMSGLAAAGAVVGGGAAAGIAVVAAGGSLVGFGAFKAIKSISRWLMG